MGKTSRRKGVEGEREVCRVLNKVFAEYGMDDLVARRVLTESRKASFDVEIVRKVPVQGEPIRVYRDANGRIHVGRQRHEWIPLHVAVQVKNRKTPEFLRPLREATQGSPGHYIPVGVTKIPRKGWVATIPFTILAALLCLLHTEEIEKGRTLHIGRRAV